MSRSGQKGRRITKAYDNNEKRKKSENMKNVALIAVNSKNKICSLDLIYDLCVFLGLPIRGQGGSRQKIDTG